VAARIISAMTEPAVVGDVILVISTSIGVAISRGARESVEDFNKRADAALYQAKAAGRNNFQFAPNLAEAA
jgi:diguanylate cyclase (GGDEF)-like protein